jgi:hypothetical protein
MYKLYTDKQELFECDIQLEGASLTNSKARLVIETEDLALLFKGDINSKGKCQIPVKRLKGLLGENVKGNIKLEVIAEDTYFTPWESDFEVEASKKVQVEVKSQNKGIIEESKPSVKVKNVNEITNEEKDHVLNILRLLVKEDISLKNVNFRKNKLNHIVATYLDKHPINESQKDTIVSGVISGLSKLK